MINSQSTKLNKNNILYTDNSTIGRDISGFQLSMKEKVSETKKKGINHFDMKRKKLLSITRTVSGS